MRRKLIIVAGFSFGKPSGPGFSRFLNYARALRSAWETDTDVYSLLEGHPHEMDQVQDWEEGIRFVGGRRNPQGLLARIQTRLSLRKTQRRFLEKIAQRAAAEPGECALLFVPMLHDYATERMAAKILGASGRRVCLEKNEMEVGLVQHPMRFDRMRDQLLALMAYPLSLPLSFMHDRLVRRFSGVIAISTRIEAWSKRLNPATLRVPILLDEADYRSAPREDQAPLRMGYMGAISESKDGVLSLVKAMGRLSAEGAELRLDLYGPATRQQTKALMKAVRSSNLVGKVQYHGLLPSREVPRAMAACDLLTLTRPSTLQTEYGFSTKLASYMASGVPVLASRVSDNPLYIKDGWNGFLVEPGHMEALCQKLRHIVNSRHELPDLGSRGRQTALEHFHPLRHAEALGRLMFKGHEQNSHPADPIDTCAEATPAC